MVFSDIDTDTSLMKVLLSPHPRSKPRPILHILPLHCTRRTTALDTTTEISLGGIKKGTKTIARHALTTNEKNNISQNDFLWAMEACLVKEVDEGMRERAQVSISNGIRVDLELLLNYGFLRGVTMEGTTDALI
eukprot:CCRYP_018156-RB/>CCRYP_018156-RB protein AED:0.19 eAED:0.19 QI:734/0.66/0.75/1/0/0/4/330/133